MMGDNLMGRAQASPYFNPLLREPVGRTAESLGGLVDMANLGLGSAYALQQNRPAFEPLVPNPPGGSEWMRQQFGLQPTEQLGSFPERAAAVGYQTLGPMVAGAGVGKVAEGLVGLGERGSVGAPKPPVVANESGPLWRDNILDAVAEHPQDTATAGQWKAHLAKYRGTKDQADWIGMDKFFAENPKPTRAQIEEYVGANKLEVEERVLGKQAGTENQARLRELQNERSMLSWRYQTEHPNETVRHEILARVDQLDTQIHELEAAAKTEQQAFSPTKYSQYTTPGGSNYRELLLKLPPKNPAAAEQAEFFPKTTQHPDLYRSSHWQDPNVLAHVRFNERTVGGQPTLFIEEIQSDWHQAGRKQGYRGAVKTTGQRENTALHELADALQPEPPGHAPAATAHPEGVPDAPFKKTWPLLAMKRMIRWAVDNGYEQVAWTSGKMQAERYNQPLQNVTAARRFDDGYWQIRTGDGGDWMGIDEPEGRELEQMIRNSPQPHVPTQGRLNAPHLSPDDPALQPYDHYDFSNQPLNIGGKAMQSFYDRELPNQVNGFVKRWGGRTRLQSMPIWKHPGELYPGEPSKQNELIHVLPITPEMRNAAQRGMELSRASHQDETAVG